MYDLSVIIVSWNVQQELRDCLNTIYANTSGLKFEIYVVDNNSSDMTCRMIREEFTRVNLIENRMNVGFAKANNQAIRLCKGKYILLLNPDTLIESNACNSLYRFMEDQPRAAACTCRILNEYGQIFAFRTKHLTLRDELFRDTIFGKVKSILNKKPEDIDYGTIMKVDRIPGTCLMVRKDIVDKIGMLDERFFLYAEDDDWCRRIGEVGEIYIVGNIEITHLEGRSSRKVRRQALIIGTLARFQYYLKYYSPLKVYIVRGLVLFSAALSLTKWRFVSCFISDRGTAENKTDFYLTAIKAYLGLYSESPK